MGKISEIYLNRSLHLKASIVKSLKQIFGFLFVIYFGIVF
jgi:hypothetical protein